LICKFYGPVLAGLVVMGGGREGAVEEGEGDSND